MSLTERVAAHPPPASQCRTCLFYADLNDEDRDTFDRWIGEGRSSNELRRLCVEEGLDISPSSFREHIRTHHKQPRS